MHAISILIKWINTNICFCLKLVWLVAKSNTFIWKEKKHIKINIQYQRGEQQICFSWRPATCLQWTTRAKPSAVFSATQTWTFLRCILKCTHIGLNFVSCGHDHLHSDGKTWGTAHSATPSWGPTELCLRTLILSLSGIFSPLADPAKKKGVCPGEMKSYHV